MSYLIRVRNVVFRDGSTAPEVQNLQWREPGSTFRSYHAQARKERPCVGECLAEEAGKPVATFEWDTGGDDWESYEVEDE